MASKRLQVQNAVRALVAVALPDAKIVGFTEDTARPGRQDPGGTVMGIPGDVGDPVGVDLSPATYYYDWSIDLELIPPVAAGLQGSTADAAIDTMGSAIGTAVVANRFLGGLADWTDVSPIEIDDHVEPGAPTVRVGTTSIIVSFSTSDPLN